MKKGRRWAGLVSVFLCVAGGPAARPSPASPSSVSGSEATVIAVYDGDTIKVRFADGRERKVRFIGVDSPEMDDSREPVEFMAHMAKRFAYLHLFSRKIRLTYDWQAEDDYGRLLAYVWTKKLGLFNEYLIREGFAFAFLKYRFRPDYRERFKKAEREARSSCRGLWRKEAFPGIPAEEAGRHTGRLMSVRFVCSRVAERGSFITLDSTGSFHALIPGANRDRFSGLEALGNVSISVTGIVEKYKDSAEIRVFVPYQIRVAGRPGEGP
ncbi:MAG: thermonuclease family protein [Acidobacteriota bacterium]|nr:thermonuclease family protein [Acidobacteriota bacterium]